MAGCRLFYHFQRYDLKGTDKLFLNEIKKNLRHHIQHCPDYAKILQEQNFDVDQLQNIDDLHKIPPIPTLFLKQHTLLSMPKEKVLFPSTTSGTSGKVRERIKC